MNIVVGFNSFQPEVRQQVSLDSWKHLLQNDHIQNLYDIQFEDEQNINHDDVETLFVLKRSSLDIVTGSTKKLPVVRDLFDTLSTKCEPDDYFIFTNNDVILNKNLIKHIKQEKPECFACSRLNIQPIGTFDDVINKNIKPANYEIYGFDTFVFKNSWWLQNQHVFNDYLLGMPVFDNVFGSLMKLFGGNHPFGNDTPPFCFHIMHDVTWQRDKTAPEREYNHHVCESNHLDRLCFNILGYWNENHLIKRTPAGLFTTKIPQEKALEQEFFGMLY